MDCESLIAFFFAAAVATAASKIDNISVRMLFLALLVVGHDVVLQ